MGTTRGAGGIPAPLKLAPMAPLPLTAVKGDVGGLPSPALATGTSYASIVDRDGDDDDDDLCTPGGKKRKVPVPLVPGSDADADTGRDGADRNPPRSAREDCDAPVSSHPIRRLPRTAASRLAAQRRALFNKRKAGLVALYLDAQGAVDTTTAHLAARGTALPTRPTLPDVSTFERLLPALEDVGSWAPDAPGWREGDDAAKPPPRRTLERWRAGFARRKRARLDRVPVQRGGWAPEGSFELDIPTDASKRAQARARERTALARLAEQLRALVLAANKLPSAPEASPVEESPPPLPVEPPAAPPPPPPTTKKNKKKKKRTTLANEGNPHHVDKYRPSRPVPVSDPYEPWPHHATLLFPPPMRVLAARPGGKDVRPGEDEYICVSCQYALFYGSEALRRNAIRERRAELRRREKLRARIHDVKHGNRVRRPSATDDDDDDLDDEGDECDGDDDAGRCTCGRALRQQPHPDDENKPPDKDPPAHC